MAVTKEIAERQMNDKSKDTKVLYRTETVEVWPHFSNPNLYHVRFPNGCVSYLDKEFINDRYVGIDGLSFEHAVMAMKNGKKLRRKALPLGEYWLDKIYGFMFEYNGYDRDVAFDAEEIMATDWEVVE